MERIVTRIFPQNEGTNEDSLKMKRLYKTMDACLSGRRNINNINNNNNNNKKNE